MKIAIFLYLAFLSHLSYAESYQETERRNRLCERMGEVAVLGFKHMQKHGYVDALIYAAKKKKPSNGAVVSLEQARIYEAFTKGVNDLEIRSAKDAHMAGWAWCMDGMPME